MGKYDAEIRKYAKLGFSTAKIAAAMGIGKTTVSNHWPEGLPMPRELRRTSRIEEGQAYRVMIMVNDGMTLRKIATDLKLPYSTVWKMWHKGPAKGKFVPSDKLIDDVRMRIKANPDVMMGQLAKAIGISRNLVRQVVLQAWDLKEYREEHGIRWLEKRKKSRRKS